MLPALYGLYSKAVENRQVARASRIFAEATDHPGSFAIVRHRQPLSLNAPHDC